MIAKCRRFGSDGCLYLFHEKRFTHRDSGLNICLLNQRLPVIYNTNTINRICCSRLPEPRRPLPSRVMQSHMRGDPKGKTETNPRDVEPGGCSTLGVLIWHECIVEDSFVSVLQAQLVNTMLLHAWGLRHQRLLLLTFLLILLIATVLDWLLVMQT